MAKGNNSGGAIRSNDKTSAEKDLIRQATKVGKNKAIKGRPANAINLTALVKMFDAKQQIRSRALNSQGVRKLREDSPSREIAILVITRYGVEKRRGDDPVAWHILRRNTAVSTVTSVAAELGIQVESKAFKHGVTIATNALNDAQADMEFCRERELRDLKRNKFSVEDVVVRFTPPPPAPAKEEVETTTESADELLAASA